MDKELMEMLAGVIERNTSAMGKMAKVTDEAAKASAEMAREVKGLRRIIAGAQQKIGGELGAVINRSKVTHDKMEAELRAIRESRKDG
jgi:hypothetical protein